MTFDLRFFFTLGLALVCSAVAAKSFATLWKAMWLGRKEILFENIPRRIQLVMRNVFGHGKMFKDFWPGLFHAFIFYGFIIITIGTTEHIIEGIFHGFNLSFLGPIYDVMATTQDFLQFLVVLAVVYFFTRRLITHPKRLPSTGPNHRDGVIVLTLTGGHMISDIMAFTFWIAGNDPHGQAAFRPFSSMLASLVTQSGLDPAAAAQTGWIFWAIHIATVFGFLMYIPHSKHLHILTAGPNIFFSRLKHRGTFSKVNFEDETQTNYGVGKVTQFGWKDILDTYSCTQCGRCNEFCPTATTGKPLFPAKLIGDLKHHVLEVDSVLLKDPAQDSPVPLISDKSGITFDTIWACTTCKACVEACPVMIEHVDKIVDMRRHMVMMEGSMPPELQNTMKNWETNSNPWGMAPDSRDEWCKDLGIPRLADKPDAEYLFYVGCAGSFNDRNKKISTPFEKIPKKPGVICTILGKEELCNGETARRAGNEYLAKMMIDANIEVLRRYNVKKILATCPHCFNTLKNEYPDFGFIPEKVIHHTEFIDDLIRSGRITPKARAEQETKIAFHDSCYLGRYNEVYEAPRSALKAIPGVEVLEMPRNKQKGMCCGAGGARMWMEETIGKRINVERTEEALATAPQVIAAGCPFCQVMITDGVKEKQANEVKVLDIAEVIEPTLV